MNVTRTMVGVMRRRLLLNWRVDPDELASLLPVGARPLVVNDSAIVGVCTIELSEVRPRRMPPSVGVGSCNTAYRYAVEWETNGGWRPGVFIPRRDSDSRLVRLLGGRLFPGVHGRARIEFVQEEGSVRLHVESPDGHRIDWVGSGSEDLTTTSVFGSLEAISTFFATGSLGLSPARAGSRLEGVTLDVAESEWRPRALATDRVHATFFNDPNRSPFSSSEFDSALLMTDVPHSWHAASDQRPVVASR